MHPRAPLHAQPLLVLKEVGDILGLLPHVRADILAVVVDVHKFFERSERACVSLIRREENVCLLDDIDVVPEVDDDVL